MYCFLGATEVWHSLVCFGSNFSKMDAIIRANIISEGNEDVLTFGVTLYTCKNCCRTFSVGVPQAFLRALFRVSTKRSAWPFDLEWYGGVMTCFIWKVSRMMWIVSHCHRPDNLPTQNGRITREGRLLLPLVGFFFFFFFFFFTWEHFRASAIALQYN